jgi:predicted O-linked N-acetylglucosamine transferase (SPINDLY family)
MNSYEVENVLRAAAGHHQAGQFAQAEQLYRKVLAVKPDHADAWNRLGSLAGQAGEHQAAVDCFRKAIAVNAYRPDYHHNLGFSLLCQGQFELAGKSFEKVLQFQPGNAQAYFYLGSCLFNMGKVEQAILPFQRAVALQPRFFEALHNLATALIITQQHRQAIPICEQALSMNPNFALAHVNLASALEHERRLPEAIAHLRTALALEPGNPDMHNNLGNCLRESGDFKSAIECYQKAVELRPLQPEFLCNLGNALISNDEFETAIQNLEAGLLRTPDHLQVTCVLARAYYKNEEYEKAIQTAQKVLSIQPDTFAALLDLGLVYLVQRKFQEAESFLQRALQIDPKSAEAYNNLGVLHRETRDHARAIEFHQKAIALKPNYFEAYHNLGNVLKDHGPRDQAIRCYLQALAIEPDHVEIRCSLGYAWREGGQLDEALLCYKKALEIDPENPKATAGLAGVYQDAGLLEQAIPLYRKAIELDEGCADPHVGLLYALMYFGTADQVAAEHKRWAEIYANPLIEHSKPFTNDPDPNRRLRIGYSSGDFRRHSVNHFMQPVYENHDKNAFDVYCYSNVAKPDAITEHLKTCVTAWRDVFNLSDEKIAEMVRDDQIDILIDVAGHSAFNRLLMLARKPAPVQVTHQGYAATTGLTAIDYRITDLLSDPPGVNDSHCSEKLIQLPQTAWVYRPPPDATDVAPLPALTTGTITFGSQNYLGKLTDTILECWMRVLREVPDSRLIIKSKGATSTLFSERIAGFRERHQIATERVQLIDFVPQNEHYQHFGKLDISLDSYPYSGTTTTCESLWMGVPVVTLYGNGHLSRVGLSLMTSMGLPELAAGNADDFVTAAKNLASDIPRLAALRAGMRQRMQQSPLGDGPGLARNLESIYRSIWRTWCKQQTSPVISGGNIAGNSSRNIAFSIS